VSSADQTRPAPPATAALDRDLAELRANATRWAGLPFAARRALLDRLRHDTAEVADEWVAMSCAAKGLSPDSPLAGEEWLSGPYAVLVSAAALTRVLITLEAGRNPLDWFMVSPRSAPEGRVALRAFPNAPRDLLQAGYTADVWLRPGVTLEQAKAGVAARLLDPHRPGTVALVLGAGNINSIPPLDTLSKLFQDNAVVMLKLNPVNAYLEPVLRRALAGFVEAGVVRITSGGPDVGGYLVGHDEVDAVHITGSRASHDALVFGPGPEGARRRADGRPLLDKPVTSELGGVGPVVVVPGPWSESTLRSQAESVATQRLHNSGFNCVATQIVVIPEQWTQAERFVELLGDAIRRAPERPAYYPGAGDRQRAAVEDHRDRARQLGGDPGAPRTLIADLDPEERDEPAFTDEYFGPVIGVARLPGATPAQFLDRSVAFCNERLAGDLGAGLIVGPRTIRDLRGRLDQAIVGLRYGTVAVNCWVGPVYGMPYATWGAFPGHGVDDVGSGIGVVHNGYLLDPDHVERTVGRGPFRPWPKPPWFVTNRTAQLTGEHMTRFAAEPSLIGQLPHLAAALVASMRG
jgi:aldehyde dehydrogenase (NAD(P)+)